MEFCKQKNGKKNETSMDIKNKRVSGRQGNPHWNLKKKHRKKENKEVSEGMGKGSIGDDPWRIRLDRCLNT